MYAWLFIRDDEAVLYTDGGQLTLSVHTDPDSIASREIENKLLDLVAQSGKFTEFRLQRGVLTQQTTLFLGDGANFEVE